MPKRSLAAFVVAIAAFTAVFLFSAPAQAQEDTDHTYVDLSIKVVVGQNWKFLARNGGTADAYGVTVDIEIADQTIHQVSSGFERNSTTCSGKITGTTCISGTWTLGFLAAGEEIEVGILPRLASGLPCCPGASDRWSVPARASITNTVPEEEDRYSGNNSDDGWISVSINGNAGEAAPDYLLEASVDNLLPAAGDTVKFTFEVERDSGANRSVYGAKLRLRLADGMGTPTATPPSGTSFAAATGLNRTWDWDFDLDSLAARSLVVSTTLDAGVTPSDLCLTADFTAERPADRAPGDTSAEICFREDPVVLLQEGQATLFSIYPCVGVTAYPCSSDDTVEMRVIGGSAARGAGIARDEAILEPDRVIVQVKDPEGRIIDTQSTSVNSGTAPSWQTAREPDSRSGNRTVGGVEVGYTHRAFTTAQRANYSQLDLTAAVAGLDGATAPGLIKIRYPDTGNVEFAPNPSQANANSYFSVDANIYASLVEFSTLGTYKLDYTAVVTHTDTTNHPDPYSDTGSYIFHVGPVAELEVRDGGAALTPPRTRAFTIVARNNGPDHAPAARVTLTGLDAASCTGGNATRGSTAFVGTECAWTIGELWESGYNWEIYGREAETLTIITDAAVDTEITATISNTQDYQVCINSSGDDVSAASQSACTGTNTWHTAKYYDYKSDNDSAAIKARDGTGAALPSLQGAPASTAAIEIAWDAIDEVNGRPVTHYEVQRQTNPWVTVAEVLGTSYVDGDVEPGDIWQYRVRAVNDRGQGGPWSPVMQGTATLVETRVVTRTRTVTVSPVYPADLRATPNGETEIQLSWSALEVFNGSPVAHYRVEVSGADSSGWSTLVDNHTPTSYAHTGLTAGDTRHYRVYAVNGNSEESDPSGTASATTGTTVTESPVSPEDLLAAPNGETEIELSWSALDEFNESPVAHYRVEVSGADSSGWSTLVDNHTPTSYTHTGLTAGDTRHYRVYAVNDSSEESDPSGTASATTGTTKVETETVYEAENPFAYFADEETTRTVAENSAPGSPVGAPVTVIRNSGNRVAYSLEGPDAALFAIEKDTGQILVGEGALLDYESDTASYTVEVVADPRSGADVKTTVTITVTDVAETGFAFIDPPGAPLVGAPLFASLLHTEGEPVEPRWQWQRSMPDGAWADIPGAIQETYTPTGLDAGRRLRALVVFGNPRGDGEGLAGAVTERVPGEAQVIPTAGTGATLEEVFGVLGHSLASVWLYDNATQTWAVYSPWNAPELNDLKTVSRGDVVWMDIIREAQFQDNTLYPGWNLVILN